MKIVQLIDTLQLGGAERMSVNIANAIAENKHKSILVSSRSGGALKNHLHPDVTYHCLNKKNSCDVKSFARLTKVIVCEKPDIIHAHSSSIYWAVLLKIMSPELKLIWHDHNGNRKNENNFLIKQISGFIDGVICVNNELKEWADMNLRVKGANIAYVRNFPSYLPFTKRKNLKKTIIHLANLRPVKDHQTLIESISILEKMGQHVIVNLVGSTDDIKCVESIKAKISEYDLEETILIKGPTEDIRLPLSSADIGILSSESEGLPLSLLEYGLAALPVVCTDVGQCREVLEGNLFGRLVPPKDPHAMAEALLLILKNLESANATGEIFKKHILAEYGAQAFMDKYNQLISAI